MGVGDLLRVAGVGRSVLGFLGWRRVGWAVSICIAVGWLVLGYAGRSDAGTGITVGAPVSTLGVTLAWWFQLTTRIWVVGIAVTLGAVLGGSVWYSFASGFGRPRAVRRSDGRRGLVLVGDAVCGHREYPACGCAPGLGAAADGTPVGAARHDLGA